MRKIWSGLFRRLRTSAGQVGAILAIAVFGYGASATGQTLYSEDGVQLRASVRAVAYNAGECHVREENEGPRYEEMKENEGQPLHLWQADVSVYNGSGRDLSYLSAHIDIDSEWPPCTNWSTEAHYDSWSGRSFMLSGGGGLESGAALSETEMLIVFHTDEPSVGEWRISYEFAEAGGQRIPRGGASPRGGGPGAGRGASEAAPERGAGTPPRRAGPSRRPASPAPARVPPSRRDPVGPAPGDVTTGPAGMEFVWIPAGEFRMGSTSSEANSDERPVTQVRISQGFWLGKYEVTQDEWQTVMGSNPSEFAGCGNCPVEQVSWDDARQFMQRLNAREGRDVYRLPTEAEWEYAARAGTTGDRYGSVDAIAWYGPNSGGRTQPVGGKTPNAWGLHDMLGNVWEWAHDWYGDYSGGVVTDPTGPGSGSGRVYRGGGWLNLDAWGVRAPARGFDRSRRSHQLPGLPPAEDTVTLDPLTLVPLETRNPPGRAGGREGRRDSARAERGTACPAADAIRV